MRLIPSLAKSGQVFDPPKLHSGPACDCCRVISSGSSRVVGCRFDCGNLVSISIQLVLRWYLPLSGSFVVAGCGQPVFFSILQEICWSIALEPGREIFLTPAILWFPILTA